MTHSKTEVVPAASVFLVLIGIWCICGFGMIKSRATCVPAIRVVGLVTLVVVTLALVGGWIVFKLSK